MCPKRQRVAKVAAPVKQPIAPEEIKFEKPIKKDPTWLKRAWKWIINDKCYKYRLKYTNGPGPIAYSQICCMSAKMEPDPGQVDAGHLVPDPIFREVLGNEKREYRMLRCIEE